MADLVQLIQDQPGTFLALGAAATASLYLYTSRPQPFPSEVPYDCQSLELPGPDKSRIAAPRYHCKSESAEWVYEDAKTTYESFLRGVRLRGDSPFLGARTGSVFVHQHNTVICSFSATKVLPFSLCVCMHSTCLHFVCTVEAVRWVRRLRTLPSATRYSRARTHVITALFSEI